MPKKRVERRVETNFQPRPAPTPDLLGVVVEALPNTLFRVERGDGETVIGYLAGKMRLHRIKVLVGDRVELEPNPYGGKQRIVKRL